MQLMKAIQSLLPARYPQGEELAVDYVHALAWKEMREIIGVSFIEGEWFGGEEHHIGDAGQRIGWFGKGRVVLRRRLCGEGDANPLGFDVGQNIFNSAGLQ